MSKRMLALAGLLTAVLISAPALAEDNPQPASNTTPAANGNPIPPKRTYPPHQDIRNDLQNSREANNNVGTTPNPNPQMNSDQKAARQNWREGQKTRREQWQEQRKERHEKWQEERKEHQEERKEHHEMMQQKKAEHREMIQQKKAEHREMIQQKRQNMPKGAAPAAAPQGGPAASQGH